MLFAASTGVRRSELFGLRWHDTDLTARTASIRQTLIDGEDGYRLEDDQKSLSAGRTIHLDQRTARMLRRHQQAQERARALLGAGWQDHGLVFPQHDGCWWNPPAVSLAFRRAV